MARRFIVSGILATLCIAPAVRGRTTQPADERDRLVGPAAGNGMVVPNAQLIRPAGETLTYSGRPLDIAVCPDRAMVIVKNGTGLVAVDSKTWKAIAALHFGKEDDGSMHGIVATAGEKGSTRIYVTSAEASLLEAAMSAEGKLTWTRAIALPGPKKGNSHALGIALTAEGTMAYVCLSRNNTLGVVDLKEGKLVAEIPVGVCPYSVALAKDGITAYVTNFGGRAPAAGVPSAKSSGTAVAVDQRGIPLSGTVSVVDLHLRRATAEIAVGLHPCEAIISRDGGRLFVANANSDSVSVIDTAAKSVAETIAIRPDANLPFGSIPNALVLSSDEKTLFCANGGNNAVAVIALGGGGGRSSVSGFIPTGWFPGGLASDGTNLYIANVKGEGSHERDSKSHGFKSTHTVASVSRVTFPDAAELARMTAQVKADAQVPQALRAMEAARSDWPAAPVPQRFGEPSVIKHVVYVLKENRTYDQVFGDIGRGNSEPKLCIYGTNITPNHHAIANQFVLLDNYYCNGIVSADGHQWATQGMVTDYQEKDLSGSIRSYDFGTDALCYAACDFLWDTALLHGLTFRNYGEFDFPSLTNNQTWFDVYKDWKTTGTVHFKQSIDIDALKPYTATDYPGWLLKIPDGYRMDRFMKEFAEYEKKGEFPNLVIVYLPQDHTSGTSTSVPTPRTLVADNDLAVGRLIEAISHSKFWSSTAIFVNEDDPQAGYDHVDGHRSLCLVASPYAKRGQIVSRFYNQTSVLHTICNMLGLPPMNQMVALAPTMEDCFTPTPDPRPYDVLQNIIALNEPNKPTHAMSPDERKLSQTVMAMDFTRPDRINDDQFNRLLWITERPHDRYPAEWAGGHGKGLKGLALKLEHPGRDKDDDD